MTAERNQEQGAVLIMSLVFLALLAVIASVAATQGRTSASMALNHAHNAKAQGVADAGIQLAIRYLAQKNLAAPTWTWPENGTPVRWTLKDGNATVAIQDEAGKIDLNTAGVPLLEALFISLGTSQERSRKLSAAIADWRDTDHFRTPGGAEDSDYRDANQPGGAKDAPFDSVDELIHVLDMDQDLFVRARPSLTVFSNASGIYTPQAPQQLQAFLQDAEQAGELARLGGMQNASTAGIAYKITSLGEVSNGGAYVREAVIELTGDPRPAYGLRIWRQGSRNHLSMPTALSGLELIDQTTPAYKELNQPDGTRLGNETVPAIY